MSLENFLSALQVQVPANTFNPWIHHDPDTDVDSNAPDARVDRLRAHLQCKPKAILVGEAPGYQGCKISGIPFTSERLLLAGSIPRLDRPLSRLSKRERPWSEPSASIVWSTLHTLGIADRTILWNAYPWHPHEQGKLNSNRTPTPSERRSGLAILEELLKLRPGSKVFAVGRKAEESLAELGVSPIPLRHPARGGASQFRSGLSQSIRYA